MASLSWIHTFLSTVFVLGLCVTPGIDGVCTLPSVVQGQWNILDSTGTTSECTLNINDTSLSGITFWDKTLSYDCYIQQGTYYVFVSQPTELFEHYDVNVYFCWYLQQVSETQFKLYELTEKVLFTIEERAKAFLNTSTPVVNDVCEVAFQSTLPHKQMQMSFVQQP